MAAATHKTKRAILAAIERLGGEAKQIEVARAMGPEWSTGPAYVRLRQTMRQMVRSNVLTTTRRGVYCVHPTFHRRGFDRRDHMVRQIVNFLIEQGGVAWTREIHEAVGARDIRDGERDPEHHRITYALAHTPKMFSKPYGPGIWALTPEARERLPLLGRWAVKELSAAKRDEFFENVGAAFAEARGDLDVEAVTAQLNIREALAVIADAAPEAESRLRENIRAEVKTEFAAKGVTDEYAVTLAAYDREDALLPLDLYLAFEAGDAELHRVAPPVFYHAVAALFGVDAARLSRGEIVAVFSGSGGHGNSDASYSPSP